jgi:hypothetical protein
MPPRTFKEFKISSVDRMIINTVELHDVDNMSALLIHEGVSEADKIKLRKYKKRANDGNHVSIEYNYSAAARELKYGRIYPDPWTGLATFSHEIRAALSAKHYDEFDCENSQPVLLCQIANKHNLNTPALEEYVEKRKEVLEALQKTHKLTRAEAKDICIAVLFGGYRDEHPLLPKIKAELEVLASILIKKFPVCLDVAKRSKTKKDKLYNVEASALAHYVQNEERLVLLTICDFLKEKEYSVDVLQHDGGSVRKKDGQSISMTLLEEAEGVVLDKVGYKVTLTLKPLTHSFVFNKTRTDIVPNNVLLNDSYAAKRLVELAGDRLRKCGSEIYILGSEGIWETGDDAIRMLIAEFEDKLVFKQYDSNGQLHKEDYGGDVKNIAKLIIQTRVWCKQGTLPLQMNYMRVEPDGEDYEEAVTLFLELVQLVCGGRANPSYESLCKYVVQWLAHALQRPYELPGVMLILSGSKGVGKDTLFDFIIQHVFGKYSAKNYSDNRQFFAPHDTDRKGMFFVKLEEADRKYCLENSSMIKGLVTSESVTFNPKNQKAVSMPNYTRYVFTTNKGNPVDFTADERRFVILPCSAEKKGDTAFWTRVRTTLFNDQIGKAVADFLLGIDLQGFNVRQLPANEYQADVVEAELSPEQRFVANWNGEKVAATPFYQLYRDYCLENDYRYAESQTRFGNLMLPFIRDNMIQKVRGRDAVYYKK